MKAIILLIGLFLCLNSLGQKNSTELIYSSGRIGIGGIPVNPRLHVCGDTTTSHGSPLDINTKGLGISGDKITSSGTVSIDTVLLSGGPTNLMETLSIDTTCIWHSAHLPENDTIKVIMLVCDTASIQCLLIEGKVETFDHHFGHQFPFYIYGYSVGRMIKSNGMTLTDFRTDGYSEITYEHIAYLDNKKKPMPSSYVVWLSKQLK